MVSELGLVATSRLHEGIRNSARINAMPIWFFFNVGSV